MPSYMRKHMPSASRFTNVLLHYDCVLNVTYFLFTFFDISHNGLIQEQKMAGVLHILTPKCLHSLFIHSANTTNTVILWSRNKLIPWCWCIYTFSEQLLKWVGTDVCVCLYMWMCTLLGPQWLYTFYSHSVFKCISLISARRIWKSSSEMRAYRMNFKEQNAHFLKNGYDNFGWLSVNIWWPYP
jgi:hypothetical protein